MKKLLFLLSGTLLPFHAAAQQAIDVHCHNVLPGFVSFLESHDATSDEGYPLPKWDAESHIRFMQEAGIGLSVLSMPAPQPYFGNSDECRRVIRNYNDECARLKSACPGKFLFCASLPLPDVKAAVDEAVYALDTLGADGIKLATNSRGQYLGDAALDTLMHVLDERRALVILHPHKPVPVNREMMDSIPLAMYEYPAETTRALINMIARNIPARYPHIRFVVPHCGSFLPLALPRMKAIHAALAAKGAADGIDWESNLRNLYFDLAGNPAPEVLKALVNITAPDHLLYGSDYPYQPAATLKENLNKLKQTLAGDAQLASYADGILYGNAAKLFSIKESSYSNASSLANAKDTQKTDARGKLPMQADGIVRLSKIEVYPEHLEEYMKFATEVGEISLRTEPGVLTMYAVAEKEDPCRITILETYASQAAYKSHIASKHFRKYKQGTLHMVKSLILSDQTPLNPANVIENFIKK